jgi:hypothetical protein
MRVSEIRQLIATTFDDLGLGDAKPAGERLLIAESYYVGCRFDYEGASVVWLEESGQLRFFSDAGKLLKIIKLNANGGSEVVKKAA